MSNKTILITVSPDAPPCVHWVAQHVQSDLRRLQSSHVNMPSHIIAGDHHPHAQSLLARHPDLPAFEGFVLDRCPDDPHTLLAASRHFRGAMFALLELTRLLGLNPLEYFTDMPPQPCDFDTLTFPVVSPVPAFRYRGLFINQEDLLTGWQNPTGPIPLEIYDHIFLTALRLGANLILPATYISPDSPVLDRAAHRGLILAQHHFQILGADVARLTPQQKSQYDFDRHPAETLDIWRSAIRQNRHRETLWSLGYRGSDDQPFWTGCPEDYSDQRKGQIISQALHAQLELLRQELQTDHPPCVFYLYRENQILYQQGHITVPPSVPVIWCDNGYGRMESYFRGGYELWGMMQLKPIPAAGDFAPAWPASSEPHPGGLYYHVAFYDGAAPNRTQYVSPAQIQSTLSRAHRLRLDNFLLLNVGNLREFVLGIAAVFDFARSPQPWLSDPRHHRTFLRNWCARHFSPALADQTANLYELFYDAHWWWSTSPGKCFGDNSVLWMLPDFLHLLAQTTQRSWNAEVVTPELSLEQFAHLVAAEGAASLTRWRQVVASAQNLLDTIPSPHRQFFHDNLLAQAQRALAAVTIFTRTAQAVLALRRHDELPCRTALAQAVDALDHWPTALAAADHPPKWTTWSRSDKIVLPLAVRHYLHAVSSLIEAHLTCSHHNLHDHLIHASPPTPNPQPVTRNP